MSKETNGRVEPYKEYSTAKIIADRWHDGNELGECSFCGLDDSPIVIAHNWAPGHVELKCKWCAERDNLAYHLKYNGVRRLGKKKTELENFIDVLRDIFKALKPYDWDVYNTAVFVSCVLFLIGLSLILMLIP